MVKKYSQLYLEARRSFMETEDQERASLLARHLLCYVSGKTHEQIVADREMYASQEVCDAMEQAGARVVGGDLAKMIAKHWLSADFEGGRHQRRVDMITAIENGEAF